MSSMKLFRLSSLALSLLVVAFATPAVGRAQTSKDSKDISGLLSEVKTEAVQLRHDADELKSFTHAKLSWERHVAKVEEIKRHVNNAGELLAKLGNAKGKASPWQQQAIDRITPMLRELASNTTATIEQLNQKPKLFQTGPYADHADANYEVASSLAELISDYVDYGKSKAKSEELASKLEVPEH